MAISVIVSEVAVLLIEQILRVIGPMGGLRLRYIRTREFSGILIGVIACKLFLFNTRLGKQLVSGLPSSYYPRTFNLLMS